MMASDRGSNPVPPPMEQPVAPPPRATTGMLPNSPFLNSFDRFLALGVILMGFALASFAVRNSDFWLHLASGRLIAQGQYEFGRDPFSYSTGDRVWVNHSWLSDLTGYQIFRQLGPRAIVVAKATLLAILTALLLATRQGRTHLWLQVVTVSLALFIMSPWLMLTPALLSLFWLAVTLLLLRKVPACCGSWALPVGFGIVCLFWANSDQWFFLGPAVVAMYLLGEVVGHFARPSVADYPDLKRLGLTLVVGIAACMLNPHHVRVWQLPVELTSGTLRNSLGQTPPFASQLHSAFSDPVIDFAGGAGGSAVTAWALLLLIALLLTGFMLNRRQMSIGLALVNVGLLALGLTYSAALPFFAVVAGPTAAINLLPGIADLAGRTWSVRTLQLLAAGRVGIRMGLLLLGTVALLACYPGWLHPTARQWRLAWEVIPDPSLMRTAEQLQQYREQNLLPTEAHGLALNAELANYCCWYAPAEKNYFDSRLSLHLPEVENFARIRLMFSDRDEKKPENFDAPALFIANGITHVTVTQPRAFERQKQFETMLMARLNGQPVWDLWAINGQMSTFGWRGQKVIDAASDFSRLGMKPMQLAFGRDVELIPDATLTLPPPKRGFTEKFLTPLPVRPAWADQSILLHTVVDMQRQQLMYDYQQRVALFRMRLIVLGGMAGAIGIPTRPDLSPGSTAVSLLAVRSARRGINESPDSPEGYLALQAAYGEPTFDCAFPQYRSLIATVTAERYFLRSALENHLDSRFSAYVAARSLVNDHFPAELHTLPLAEIRARLEQQGGEIRLDMALIAMRRARAILQAMPQADAIKADMEYMDGFLKRWDEEARNEESRWRNNTSRSPSPLQRADEAFRNHWLPLKALEELKKIDLNDTAKLPIEQRVVGRLLLSRLYLLSGQAELADLELAAIDKLVAETPDLAVNPQMPLLLNNYREARLVVALVLGRFSEAQQLLQTSLADQQLRLDRLRQNELPRAAAMNVARQLALTTGIGFGEVMTAAYRPYLSQNFLRLSRQGFRGSPFTLPYYDTEILEIYRQQVFGEAEFNLQIGKLYLEQGDNRNAAVAFRQVLRIFPTSTRLQISAIAQAYLLQLRGL